MSKNDGGPAFPSQHYERVGEVEVGDPVNAGMTLRDWFAGQALAGLLGDSTTISMDVNLARVAYEHADKMLLERER